jgi:hypothetical protein
MSEKEKRKQDSKVTFDDLGDLDDLFGLNEEDVMLPFKCIDCGYEEPVPEFIVDEFSWGLKKGEEVEMFCPECNGTLKMKREEAKD